MITSGNGHLTRTPELRHAKNGKAVTTVSIASANLIWSVAELLRGDYKQSQ